MELHPLSTWLGAGLASFVFTLIQLANNWKNRSVGQQKDEVLKAKSEIIESENRRQTGILDLQTGLLYEIRSRFDKLEGGVGKLEMDFKEINGRLEKLEAFKS